MREGTTIKTKTLQPRRIPWYRCTHTVLTRAIRWRPINNLRLAGTQKVLALGRNRGLTPDLKTP